MPPRTKPAAVHETPTQVRVQGVSTRRSPQVPPAGADKPSTVQAARAPSPARRGGVSPQHVQQTQVNAALGRLQVVPEEELPEGVLHDDGDQDVEVPAQDGCVWPAPWAA